MRIYAVFKAPSADRANITEYSISKNSGRPMDIVTNSFCAGGTVLGNGTWLNVGGNQAVKPGGDPADSQKGGGVYDDPDGGKSCVALHMFIRTTA